MSSYSKFIVAVWLLAAVSAYGQGRLARADGLATISTSGHLLQGTVIYKGGTVASTNKFTVTGDTPRYGNRNRVVLANPTAATVIDCQSGSLDGELILSSCTALTTIYSQNNSIVALDVAGCTALTYLDCLNNDITTLDVSGFPLTALYCNDNSLTALDVSGCTSLTILNCYNNSLDETAVDLVLADLVANGASYGQCDITGNAAPSAAGVAFADFLCYERFWLVTYTGGSCGGP